MMTEAMISNAYRYIRIGRGSWLQYDMGLRREDAEMLIQEVKSRTAASEQERMKAEAEDIAFKNHRWLVSRPRQLEGARKSVEIRRQAFMTKLRTAAELEFHGMDAKTVSCQVYGKENSFNSAKYNHRDEYLRIRECLKNGTGMDTGSKDTER